MLANTLLSRTAPEVLGASIPDKLVGNISMHFTNSNLFGIKSKIVKYTGMIPTSLIFHHILVMMADTLRSHD